MRNEGVNSAAALYLVDPSSGALRSAGTANGIATLDSMGTVPLSQIPSSVIDGLTPQTAWNAATNTPNLVTATPNVGDFWWVSVAGSTSLGGITPWTVGQWAVYGASGWAQMTPGGVLSFNTRSGYVVPVAGDYDGLALNLAAASSFRAPVGAGAAPTAAGGIAFDSTGAHLQIGDGASSLTVLDETSIGVDVQAYDANLDAWADTSPTTYTGSSTIATVGTVTAGTWSGTAIGATNGGTGQTTITAGDLLIGGTNALNKLAVGTDGYTLQVVSGLPAWRSPSQARSAIGVGTIATQDANNVSISGGSITGITDLAVADGGTGGSTPAAARDGVVWASAAAIDPASPYTVAAGIDRVTFASSKTMAPRALANYVDGQTIYAVNSSASTITVTITPADGTIDASASVAFSVPPHGVVGCLRTSSSTWVSVQPGSLTANGARIAINSGVMQARAVYVYQDGTTLDLGPWVDATTGGTDQATLSGSDLVVNAGAATATTNPGANGERWTWALSDLGLTVPSGTGMFSGVVNCTSMSDGARVASSTMVALVALGTGATTPNRFFGFSRPASGTNWGSAMGATTGSIFLTTVTTTLTRVRGVGPYQSTSSLQWTTQHFSAPGVLTATPNATVADAGLSGALTTLGVYAQRTGSATSTTDWTIAGFTAVMTWSGL